MILVVREIDCFLGQIMKILAIIPAYNEQDSISTTISDLRRHHPRVDIVVINDCSQDQTAAVAKKAGAIVITLPVNLGIGGAVQTGLKYGREMGYDYAFQFDGDGQHRGDELSKLVQLARKNQRDLVIGSRFATDEKDGFKSTFLRRMGIKFFSILLTLFTRYAITDPTSGFRLFNRRAMIFFAEHYPCDFPEPEVIAMAHKQQFSVEEVPVLMNERLAGESSINTIKSVIYMIKVTLAVLFSLRRRVA